MTELTWDTIRADAIVKYGGQTPRPHDETNIVNHFTTNPLAVLHAIDQIAATNNIRWKWSALAARLEKTSKAAATATVNTGPSRETLIKRTDQWLRNTGHLLPTWNELEDELFGDRGTLRTIDTPALRQRYHNAWQSLQPQEEAA